MKWYMYTIVMLILVSSCKSIQDLVEKGDYDGAIELALNKLHGQKNKKTKHVKGLETAFIKIMDRDLRTIERLNAEERSENWDLVYDLLMRIDQRQDMIRPFLPLVSKDGYAATFKFIRTHTLLDEAATQASVYHYDEALEELSLAEQGNKSAARTAYNHLEQIRSYFSDFRDMESLMDKALSLGKSRTLVKLINTSDLIIPAGFEQEILSFNLYGLNSRWQQFYHRMPDELSPDYLVLLELRNLALSPEREKEIHFIEQKDIEDGWEYILDSNGDIAVDSLGNKLTTTRYITVQADVVELTRQKTAAVDAVIKIIDDRSKDLIYSEPIHVESVFHNCTTRYYGDKRALSKETKSRLRSFPEPFPRDDTLTLSAAEKLKDIFYTQIRQSRFT